MPRPKQRTPALRDELLSHALALLAGGGPAAVTARGVAQGAGTSTAAVYELFEDKHGLVRAIYLEGFRRIASDFSQLAESADPRQDLVALVYAFRNFARAHPGLTEVMFNHPFQDFRPGSEDIAHFQVSYRVVMSRVERALAAGLVAGEPRDIALMMMATAEGLIGMESSGRLGRTQADRDRRWERAVDMMLRGLWAEGSEQEGGGAPQAASPGEPKEGIS